MDDSTKKKRILLTIYELKTLTSTLSKQGAFIQVTLLTNDHNRIKQDKTLLIYDKLPMWMETFQFNGLSDAYQSIQIDYKTGGMKQVASLTFNLPELKCYEFVEDWFPFEVVEKKRFSNQKKSVNLKIRIGICYMEDIVLPSKEYKLLKNVLLENLECFRLMTEQVESKNYSNFSKVVVTIFREINPKYLINLIQNLLVDEIENSKDPDVLFRQTSIGTKLFEEFLYSYGSNWRDDILLTLFRKISADLFNLAAEGDALEQTSVILDFVRSILTSSPKFPKEIQHLLHIIRESTMETFGDPDLSHVSVSSFVMLRLFSPALLNPKLFGLMENPTKKQVENCTILSSFIQKLANLAVFNANTVNMSALNDILTSEHDNMRVFIQEISDPLDFDLFEDDYTIYDLNNVRIQFSILTRMLIMKRSSYPEDKDSPMFPIVECLDNLIFIIYTEHPTYWVNQSDLDTLQIFKIEKILQKKDPKINLFQKKKEKKSRSSSVDYTESTTIVRKTLKTLVLDKKQQDEVPERQYSVQTHRSRRRRSKSQEKLSDSTSRGHNGIKSARTKKIIPSPMRSNPSDESNSGRIIIKNLSPKKEKRRKKSAQLIYQSENIDEKHSTETVSGELIADKLILEDLDLHDTGRRYTINNDRPQKHIQSARLQRTTSSQTATVGIFVTPDFEKSKNISSSSARVANSVKKKKKKSNPERYHDGRNQKKNYAISPRKKQKKQKSTDEQLENAYICEYCNKVIVDDVKKSKGKTYHIRHFKCTRCKKVLSGGKYGYLDRQQFCETCFQKLQDKALESSN